MRTIIGCAALTLLTNFSASTAFAQSTEIRIWSWNIAASSLKTTAAEYMKQHPDVKIIVEDYGNAQVFDKTLAGCAAGGVGLPDIVTIQNGDAESFWSQFPDCFTDLKALGYTPEVQAKFPQFKRTELEVGDKAYAMPWDTGPVVMFYRRDLYEKAGVDPATIVTWDDFIAAGKKISEANPGVVMSQADLNGDDEFMRMIGNEQGCNYFSDDGSEITINQPACVSTLDTIKKLKDTGTISAAKWDEKIQSVVAGKVATQLYGGWYEGTLRTNAPDLAGKWGVYTMPSVTADGLHAANVGGSALGITSISANKEAAYAYLNYTLGTNEGQISMLKAYGLVPSLISALDDPYVHEKQPYWGDQAIWVDILSGLPRIRPSRGTAFYQDAKSAYRTVQVKYLEGGYPDAKTALDDAAKQISSATGLEIAH